MSVFNFQIPLPKRPFFDDLKPDLPELWKPPQLELGPLPEMEQVVEPEGRVSVTPPVRDIRDVPAAIRGYELTKVFAPKVRNPQSTIRNQTSTPPEATTGQEPASVFTEAPADAARSAINNQGGLTRKISGYEAIANKLKTEKAIAAGGNVVQSRNLETQKVPVRFSVNIPQGTIGTAAQVKQAILHGAGFDPRAVEEIERAIGAPLLRFTPDEEREIEATVNFYRKPVTKTMAEGKAYGKRQLYRYASETNVPRSAFAIYEAFMRGGPDAAREASGMLERDILYEPESRPVTEAERAGAKEAWAPSKNDEVEAWSQFGQSLLKQGLGIPEGAARIADDIVGSDELTRAVRPFTEATQGVVERMMPVDQRNESWTTAKIPAGVGSAVGFMLGGGLLRAPKLGSALLGAATNVQQVGREFDAVQAAQPYPARFQGNRRLATALAAGTGALEAFGIEGRMGRFGTRSQFLEAVKGRSLGEAGQESFNSLMNDLNAVYGGKYDPKRSIGQEMMESFALGAIVGTGFEGTSFLASNRANRRERLAYAAGVAQQQPESPLGQIVNQAGITLETISQADDRAVDELTKRLEVWAKAEAQLKQLQAQREQLAEQAQGAEAKLQTGRVPTGLELQVADQVAQLDEQIVQTQIVQDETVAEIEEKASPLFRRLRDAAQQEQEAPSKGPQAPSKGPQAPSIGSDAVISPAGGEQGIGNREIGGIGQQGQSPLFRRIAEAVAATQPQVEPLTDVQDERPDMLAEIRRGGGMTGDVEAGELRRIGLKEGGTTGLVQRTGLSPDEMRERMASEGLTQADTATDFIQEVEEQLRRRQQRGEQAESSYENYARAQMSEGEREQSDRLDSLLTQPQNPFTQAFRRLSNPRVPFSSGLVGEFVEEAQREGFDDNFIEGRINDARASRGITGPRVEPERVASAPAQAQPLSQLERDIDAVDRRIADKRRQGEETADDWSERRQIERQVEQITGEKLRDYPKQPVPQEPAPPVRANVIPEWMRNRNVYRMGGREITEFVQKLREEKARQEVAGRDQVDRGLWNTTRMLLQSAEAQRREVKNDKSEVVPPLNEPRRQPQRFSKADATRKFAERRTAADVGATIAGATSEQEGELPSTGTPEIKERAEQTLEQRIVNLDDTLTDDDLERYVRAETKKGLSRETIQAYLDDNFRAPLNRLLRSKQGVAKQIHGSEEAAIVALRDERQSNDRANQERADRAGDRQLAAEREDMGLPMTPLETVQARITKIHDEMDRLRRETVGVSPERRADLEAQSQELWDELLQQTRRELDLIEDARKEEASKQSAKEKEGSRTVTHPNPELDRQPILAETNRGTVLVANPANKTGVSEVKDRSGEPVEHKFSSTQINLPAEIADKIIAFGKQIPDADIAEDGREIEPHITIKYGLHGWDSKFAQEALAGEGPITVTFGRVSLFENEEADVVKLDIESPDLHRLNKKVASSQPQTETHAEYKPHATIAYVRKGSGAKYVGDTFLEGQTATLNAVTFSGRDGEKVEIPLSGAVTAEEEKPATEADLSDFFDDAIAEMKAEAPPAVALTEPKQPQRRPGKPKQPKPASLFEEEEPRTTGEAVTSAVKKTGKGLDAAAKAMSELFGGPKLSMGLTFDEDTYAKAKPHFQEAWDHFADAAADARAAMGLFLRALRDEYGFAIETLERMKPYVLRFVAEERGAAQVGAGLTQGVESAPEVKADEQVGEPDQGADEGIGGERVTEPESREREGELRSSRRGRSGPARSRGDGAERGDGESRAADVGTEAAAEPIDRGSHEEFSQDETRAEDQSPSATKRAPDYIITDDESHTPAGTETKLKANFTALRLLRTLEAEGRTPTVEEQRQLAEYTGWGQFPDVFDRYSQNFKKRAPEREELIALVGQEEYDEAAASTLNAHYTHPAIARAMWRAIEKMGFKGRRVIEPGVGIGNFIGVTPDNLRKKVKWTGVDKNPTSSAIAKMLYPSANIQVRPYESLKTPDGFFDLAIGNVPFGDYKPYDPRYKNFRANIHDYFFLKTLDQVRPGGVLALITSTGTMDKLDPKIRQAMAEKADLVAAIRLPGKTFAKNAGTEVVTDIIILRPRADGENPSDVKWMETAEVPDPDGGRPIQVNEYFRDNPDQVLGRIDRTGKMYRGNSVNVTRLDDFEEKFAAAIERLPENVFTERGKVSSETWSEPEYAEAGQRQGSTVIKDGKVFTVEKLQLKPRELNAKDRERVIGMMKLRDLGQAVLDAQRKRQDEAAVSGKRAALKSEYDRFTRKHGFLHQRTNAALLAEDIDGPIILALENWDAKTKKGTVADLAITPPPRSVKPENAGDAVAQSLRDHGKLDLDQMAEALGTTPEELGRRLVSEGLAFNDPSVGWVDRAEYLSGNVRRKLLEAQDAAAADPSFEPNVKELQEVQPDDIPTDEIYVKLGAPWMPPSDVATFVKDLLGLNTTDGFDLAYLTQDGSWNFSFRKTNAGYTAASSEAARKLFATERASFADILNAGLNDVPIRIFDEMTGPNREKIRSFNSEASSEANGRVYELKERFKEWIWEDEARSKRLHRFYNDNFNNLRTRKFDALHYRSADGKYRLPGMSPRYDLRPQQANAVYRAVQDGVALFGHEVGVGKSATMIAAAMEHRRLGLAKKPLIATMKSVLPGLAMEARRFYPGAKVLVVEGGLDAEKRKRMMAQIATGDWDMVITTHDNLEALPVRPEWAAGFIKQQLDEVTAAYLEAKEADSGSRVVKELEKLKQKLTSEYAEIINEKKRDDAVYFEDLGVDMMVIDEFHKYKSLPVYTAQRGVKGIPTRKSDRALDMLMKLRWIHNINNGRNIYGATGTPITNSVVEVFSLQRYFQPEELESRGVQAFDAWAKTFGEFSHRMEFTQAGDYQPVTRFNRFANLQELMQLTRKFLDVVFASDVGAIKRPMRKEDVVAVPPTAEQLAYLGELQDRMAEIRRLGKRTRDNALAVGTDARKMSLDYRLIDSAYVATAETKVDRLVANVLRIAKENPGKTQMIFSDLGINPTEKSPFSVYQDIISRLVAGGIPRDKIIDFSTITDTQRKTAAERLFDADALIGIGGSEKMGTGVNAQQHLIALHHLDVPYVPAFLEQRDGRGWRQGNLNSEIMINRYVTENSFDTFMWQLIDSKSRFIRAFMKGDENARTVSEEEGDSFTEAQIMAIASGDPDLLARVQLEDDITNLERSERQHNRQQSRLRDTQERLQKDIPRLERRAARMEEDAKYIEELPDNVPKYVVGGKTFEKRDLTAIALRDAALAASWTQPVIIGTYKDFDIIINRAARSAYISRDSAEQTNPRYDFSPNLDEPLTMMASIEGQARNIEGKAKKTRSEYETAKTDLEKISKEIGKTFAKADQLQAKKAELAELNAKMKAKSKPEEEKAEESKVEEGGVLASFPDRGAIAAGDVASPVDHFYHAQLIIKGRGKRGAVVYINDHAKMILAAALDEVTGRKYYQANALEVSRENLQKAVAALESEALENKRYKADILRVVEEWERVLEDNPRQQSFTFHDVTEFARRREAEIPSDREAIVRRFKGTSREERFHWSQRQVVGGQGLAQVGASWAQSTKGWGKYRRALMSPGYPDNPEILAAEIAAHIAAQKYDALAVRTEAEIAAAEDWLARYFERIAERYGIEMLDKFGSLLAHAGRAREKAGVNVRTRQAQQSVAGAQAGQAGATGIRPPPAGGGGRRVQGGAHGGQGRPGDSSQGVRQTSPFSPSLPPETIDEQLNVGPMPEWQRGLGEMKSPTSSPGDPVDAGAMPEWQLGLGSIKSPQFSPNEPINPGEMPEDQQQLIETKRKRNTDDFLRVVGDLWHLPKSLRSSGDISATLRQGFFLVAPPWQWHLGMKAFGRQISSYFSQKDYDRFVKAIRADKDYQNAKAAGLYIASDDSADTPINEREEHFVSEMANNIPWVKMSERAFKIFLDSVRFDTFKKYKKSTDKQVRDPGERFEGYQAAAEWINTSSGRGKFHGRFGQAFDKALPFLNIFGFAPRYAASRIQMLNPLTYARNLKSPQHRVVFRRQMSELFGAAAVLGMTGALASAMGASISFDDEEADFFKIRFGSTRYDVMAGLQQVLRLAFKIGRWVESEITEDDEKVLKTSRREQGRDALKYLRGKLSPSMGFIVDWLNDWTKITGERHAPGEFVSSFGEGDYPKMADDIANDPVISQALPLIATDLVSAWYNGYRNTGDPVASLGRAAKVLPASVGIGVQDYDRPEYAAPIRKTLKELGIDRPFPKKGKYETDKEHEQRIPRVIEEQSEIIEKFKETKSLQDFPKDIRRKILSDAIDEDGRERAKKLRPEWLHEDWRIQATIEEWKLEMEKNPVFKQMSSAAKKAAMESFTRRMSEFKAQAGKKTRPPRPFTSETVRKIIAKSLNQ